MIDLTTLKTKASPILADYDVTQAAVFGSVARGQASSNSDLDLLVKLDKKISLLKFIELKQKLEDTFQTKVDLVQFDRIKPSLKPYILADQKIFYQKYE